MSLVTLLVVLVVIGVVVYAIQAYVPMEPNIKRILVLAGIIVAVAFVLSAFGICDQLRAVTVPRA